MVRGLLVVALLSGCTHQDPGGQPPARSWGTGPPAVAADPRAAPHAPPDAGGLPPAQDWGTGSAAASAAPDAGVDANHAADVSSMGLQAPDPNRPIDPSHHVAGVIELRRSAAGKAKPGTAVFVVVKQVDASGRPAGPPLAVEKLTWPASGHLPFRLTEADAMLAGLQLTGKVVIVAHYDQDGDALTKQPGDLLGQARATVPADHVRLYLDQVP